MRGVYAPATGILECSEGMPASGSSVAEGTQLFSIHDLDAIQDVIRAEGMRDLARKELADHQQAQSKEIETCKSVLENAETRLDEATAERDKRKLKSPCSGRYMVMPATPPTGPWSLTADSLQYSWDNPMQDGRLIPKGTMLATICGSQMMAIIPLNDSQLEWVFSGTEVRLRCIERAAEVHRCKVDKVVALEDVSAAWRLMNGDLADAVPIRSSSSMGRKHGAAAYAAQVVLPMDVVGSVGARIDGVFIAPSQTVGSLCYRWLQQNLRWLAD